MEQALILRAARAGDSLALLEWRNDPTSRSMSVNGAPVEKMTHQAWFDGVLTDPDVILLVGEDDRKVRVGCVRVNRRGDGRRGWTISVNVAPDARGRGVGRELVLGMVRWLREREPDSPVFALVQEQNQPSRRMFERCGFLLDRQSESWLEYLLSPPL
jgi:RimJ/RimL family protein N-acetyltransferase